MAAAALPADVPHGRAAPHDHARPHSTAANLSWYFLVSDRTFVDVRPLLRTVAALRPSAKAYYGAIAESSHKESFGFHEYVDLNGGVLLAAGGGVD